MSGFDSFQHIRSKSLVQFSMPTLGIPPRNCKGRPFVILSENRRNIIKCGLPSCILIVIISLFFGNTHPDSDAVLSMCAKETRRQRRKNFLVNIMSRSSRPKYPKVSRRTMEDRKITLISSFRPVRSLFSLTITAFLVFGSANSRLDHARGLPDWTNRAASALKPARSSVLRLRGSGDHDACSEAAAAKELGNAAYKEKKFTEALEHYEKVCYYS